MRGGYEVNFIPTFQRLNVGCHCFAVVVVVAGFHDVCFEVVAVIVVAAAAAAQYPLVCDMLQSRQMVVAAVVACQFGQQVAPRFR